MLRQKYLSIVYFICTINSCKCQDLEKFVAPILDNQNAPLVAIVDTTNISAHIVRSIEIPLREIINSTTQCKIKEELKKYAVSSQRDVNGQLETLQHKIDKHIEDLRDQFTVVNQDIVSLRQDTEDTILHEILEHKMDLIKLVDTLKSDLDEKMNNLSSNVVFVQSGVQKKIDDHITDNRDQFTVVQQNIATLRKEMDENISHEILENMKNFTTIFNTVNKNLDEKVNHFTKNVEIIQSELRKTKLCVDNNVSMLSKQLEKHSNNLGGHNSRLDDLNASVNAINLRAQQQQKLDLLEIQLANAEEINDTKLPETVNLKILPELGSYEYVVMFIEPYSFSYTEPVLYIFGHDNGDVTIKSNSFSINRSITKGKNEIILQKEVFLRDGIEYKGIHIQSTVPISLNVFSANTASSDGYAAIPIKYMSTKYIVSTFTVWRHKSHAKSVVGIVSLSGKTEVQMQLKMKQGTVEYEGKEFANGEIIHINMSALQTFQLSHTYDLSGSMISSSKPIGVVSGNKCNMVISLSCSHFTEMMLPVNQLDSEFIIPSIQTRQKSTVRLLSPGTNRISVHLKDRHYNTDLNEGEYHDLIHNDISVVQSSSDILITTFPHETNNFHSYMMTVYGINQYKSNYDFIIPSNFTSFVSITFLGDAIRGFEIDGHKMKANTVFEKNVNGKKYITFSFSIAEGGHIIKNNDGLRFGLWLYGNRINDGYGYPAGIAFWKNSG